VAIYIKDRCIKIMLSLLVGSVSHSGFASSVNTSATGSEQQTSFFSAFSPKRATVLFQAGGFYASQGKAQDIGINGLVGDRFTVTHENDGNALLGLGYYLTGLEKNQFSLLFGINAFYLAPTTVQGNVIQEQLFTNLSYSYSITQYPIYLVTKAFINTNSDKYTITGDLGIGPNIIRTGDFSERSLDGGVTIPENPFTGQTSVAFSATAGVGVKFNNVIGRLPLEVGYRFFYLGQGSFSKNNNQILNTLKTGNSYANALIFSIHL
jgi:hypothetical protein